MAQVDAMSGGRVELGLGAGWFEAEHRAYGIPFPPTGERFDRLEEQLTIVTGLWATPVGETFTFRGAHYELDGSPALPKPRQRPGPPVIVGGTGARRTPTLAARFAHEYNVPFASVETARTCYERVAAASKAEGRGPQVFSVAQTVCCGRNDSEVGRRADAIGYPVDELREHGLCGPPTEVVDKIGRFAEAGAHRVHLQLLDLADLDHLDLIASAVAPQLE